MKFSAVVASVGSMAVVSTALALPVQAAPDTGPAAVTPLANPTISNSCGLDATLVLDASGSIQTSNAVEQVRSAGKAFVRALKDTKSTARVTQFATFSEQLAPRTLVDAASTSAAGALTVAMNKYYNPKPPRPADSTIYKYKGNGAWNSPANYTVDNTANQYTNWDAGMTQAGTEATAPELVVFVTDGDPTAFNLNRPGDPNYGNGKNVAMNTDRGDALQQTIDRAVDQANNAKSRNTRVMVVGVGPSVTTPGSASVTRMKQMSGPQVVQDSQLGTITNINQIDVALVKDFDKLGSFLRQVVSELCTPSMTIRKWAQSADSGAYTPAPGWNLEVTPTVPGGFDWILPDTAPAASKNEDTDAQGYAQFQWEPRTSTATSNGHVAETLKSNFTGGRPGQNNDWICELRTPDDDAVQTVKGDFANPDAPQFDVTVGPRNIVTCDIYNSYNYAPDINVVKSAVDTVTVDGKPTIRGNGDGWNYKYRFDVTNPGNTPLSGVKVTDGKCDTTPDYISGDTNSNERLDPGETWVFQCDKFVLAATTDQELKIDNTATASGVAPNASTVQDQDSATVYVRTPAMKLTKTADPVTVPAGAPVTYTYKLTNTGNDPISDVTIGDDKCSPLDGPSGVLGVGETRTYTCTTEIYEPTINTADASGNWSGYTPTGQNNTPVTAQDRAEVDVTIPAYLTIVKQGVPTEDLPFDFTASGTGLSPGDESFTLNPDSEPSRTLVVNAADAGTQYTVTEGTMPTGWYLSDLQCDQTATTDTKNGQVQITLQPGDEATCVYTNTKKGSVTIRKVTEPEGSTQDFAFTATGVTPDQFTLSDEGEKSFINLTTGSTVEVTETGEDGWELADISCNDESTTDVSTGTVTITVGAAFDTVCTFTNREVPKATLTVLKQADPVSGTFDYTVKEGQTTLESFSLSPSSSDPMPTNTIELSPATGKPTVYTVSEVLPDKWDLIGAQCEITDVDGNTSTVNADANGNVDVPLGPGYSALCSYSNQRQSTLTIIKNTSVAPGDEPPVQPTFDFLQRINYGTPSSFQLQDFKATGQKHTIEGLKDRDVVQISETIPGGWSFVGAVCVGSSYNPSISVDGAMALVLAAGEDVTCAFTNAKTPPAGALLQLVKLADPADDTPFQFTVSGVGVKELGQQGSENVTLSDPSASSQTLNIKPQAGGNEYTISEAVPAAWEQTTFQCRVNGGPWIEADSNGEVKITIQPADSAACFTVNRKLGSLTIIKQTNPEGASQTFRFEAGEDRNNPTDVFDLTDGQPYTMSNISGGTSIHVTEAQVENWELQDMVCSGAGLVEGNLDDQHYYIEVPAGAEVICTWFNTEIPPAYVTAVKVADPEDGTNFGFMLNDNVGSPQVDFSLAPPDVASDTIEVRPARDGSTQYTLAEVTPTGWDLTETDCAVVDVQGNVTQGSATAQALQPGSTLVCAFTNRKQSTFEVIKDAQDGGDLAFPFEANVSGTTQFSLKDGESKDWSGIPANTVAQVVESIPDFWTLDKIVCGGPGLTVDYVQLDSGYVQVQLAAGADGTCAYVNVPTIYDPKMTLEKSASPSQVLPNGSVTYTYTLTNAGDIALNTPAGKNAGNALSDDKCQTVTLSPPTSPTATQLGVGQSWTYTCTTTLSTTTTNTATVTMTPDNDPTKELEVTDNEVVEVLTPAISIVKTASANTVYSGDQVTYQYSVTNPGQVPLADVTVTDNKCTPTGPKAGWDLNNNDLLDPLTEEQIWECTQTLTTDTTNQGMATGTPQLDKQPPGTPVTDTDTETVTVLDPGLTLQKTPSATGGVWDGDVLLVASGTEVTFTYEVTNTGNTSLELGSGVVDNRCSPVDYVSGDTNTDGLLSPGEVWTYECKTTPVGDTGVIVNTASVTGTDPELGRQVSDDDDAQIESLSSGIGITKRADKILIEPGSQVTYTYVVVNTGRTVLHDVVATDDKCAPVTYVSGDANSDGKLDLDERWTYTCSTVLVRDTENVVTVTGKDPGENTVTDQSRAIVQVFGDSIKPGIEVTKKPSATEVAAGTQVTYTYEVRNTGNVVLADVTISDDKCSPVVYVSGDEDKDGLLANTASGEGYGDEVWKYECSSAISVDTTNTVVVRGWPWQNGEIVGKEVTAQAKATVKVTATPPVPPTPTPTPTPGKPRLPIITDTNGRTTYKPGSFVSLVDSSRTRKQGTLKYRTRCRPMKASAAGEVSYCKVRVTKNGKVKVKVMGYTKVRVTVFIRAVPKPKYRDQWRANSWKRTWILKPKR